MDRKLMAAMAASKKVIEERTTAIYGGLALALHQIGIPTDQIVGLMEMTDRYWNDSITEGWDMTERVRQEVGLDIVNVIEEKKR